MKSPDEDGGAASFLSTKSRWGCRLEAAWLKQTELGPVTVR